MSPGEITRASFVEIRAHKMRSGLTLLGIVLGTLSITVMTSMLDGVVASVWEGFRDLGFDGVMFVQGREPRGGHPSLVPSQLYPTADGWIFIMCNKEVFWPVLAEKLGRPEWGTDPRFARFPDRLANKAALNALLHEGTPGVTAPLRPRRVVYHVLAPASRIKSAVVPVFTPLPNIARHVIRARAVRLEGLHGRGALVPVRGADPERERPRPGVALRLLRRQRLIAPDVKLPVQSAPRHELSLGLTGVREVEFPLPGPASAHCDSRE